MKKLKWGLMLALLLLVLGLAACGSGDEDTSGNADNGNDNSEGDTQEDVNLRVVTTMAGTDPAGEVFQEALDAFEEEHPHVTIENDSQSADAGTIRTKVNTDFSSDNEPDLMFYFNTVDAEGIIEEGKVVNLEEAEGIDLSGYNSMLEQQRYSDGNIYAAPQSGFYESLFVNKKLFEEYDIELPTTWELYEKAIEEFAKTDEIVPLAASTEDSYYVVEHYALAAGGIENYNAELADRNPAWAEGLDLIKKHADMGAFTPDAATIDLALAQELFKQEQAAMIFEGSWLWGQLEEAGMGEDVAVLPMPIKEGGETGELVGGASQGWFISTKSYEDDSKKDAVVDLFNYLTSEETIVEIAGATGQPPAKGELADLPDYLKAGHDLVANAPAVALPINDRINPESFTHLRTSVPAIVNGEKTGEEVLEKAAEMAE